MPAKVCGWSQYFYVLFDRFYLRGAIIQGVLLEGDEMDRKVIDDSEASKQRAERPTPKKAYQAPSFRFERVFETRALVCGKVQSTQGQCALNRKTS
jgi:hypothetical protein